ncbi:MAG: PEP-CTERM sorting domain-containing protein [Phycisphaerales bacterium]|nr:PEP-CTERM sorting domain-containing protein [Phycisphaerales bacterium]
MVLGLVASAAVGQAAQVWESTFDSTADGVVDIFTGNANKAMIGPVTSGELQITTQDTGGTYAYIPDRAGRALGTAQGGTDSFSGLYRFNWSTLNTTSSEITEAVGFIGNHSAQSRQFVGGRLRHYQIGGDYLVGLDVAFGSTGHLVENFATAAGPLPNYAINLGPNALNTDYQLAVGWDGTTRTISLALYDDQGNLLGQHSGVLSPSNPALIPSSSQGDVDAEVADLSVTHLGWGDYTSVQDNTQTVWNVDSLAYYNTADGAFTAAVPEPGTLSVLGGLAMLATMRRRRK